ncbi:hypothetical protein BSR29_07425 [Boudabousia liubingyangii]|uniref:Uncharacterized protein n=1 Tax=Boudabousia liubingyangii TaxID=1921764 RepID=A0A1Q5PK95_9ACTO|nr:hypothetical protein [Boudabousia liubingyangii]OKL46640.1 hypothetical protein BSR29_07425 [Boudabousia liubingyangii]
MPDYSSKSFTYKLSMAVLGLIGIGFFAYDWITLSEERDSFYFLISKVVVMVLAASMLIFGVLAWMQDRNLKLRLGILAIFTVLCVGGLVFDLVGGQFESGQGANLGLGLVVLLGYLGASLTALTFILPTTKKPVYDSMSS